MKTLCIGFIGAGNMASALIGGLRQGHVQPKTIYASDPSEEKLLRLQTDCAVQIAADNQALVDTCDVVVLAVKPQVMHSILHTLQFKPQQLLISIAAGIRSQALQKWTREDCAIVRCMPNTPALVQCAATGLFANHFVSAAQKRYAEQILSAVGLTLWVDDEQLLDAVTAVSGSGPAYFFYLMEAIEAAGIEMGLPAETSRTLTMQTALGAAKLALNNTENAAELRNRVTSPGGTTEAAINVLQSSQALELIKQAIFAAQQRSQELAEQLENNES